MLEGPADAEMGCLVGMDRLEPGAVEDDIAVVGPVDAVDHIEKGALAGAVRSDQRANLPCSTEKLSRLKALTPLKDRETS